MQKVIYSHEIQNYKDYIDQSVIDYIGDWQVETYESFENFDLIAFDWYDLTNPETSPAQILIYIDREDLFYICENEESFLYASECFSVSDTNEHALYLFFRNLFKNSSRYIEDIESRISKLDDAVSDGAKNGLRENLTSLRNEILRDKKYYEHLEFLFEEICDNDNSLISGDCLKYFQIMRNRSIHLVTQIQSLRDYISQVRESYQAQIGIEQNNLMKVFTLVTSIFLPLTLIVGWYGMNLKMPEFGWQYGYLYVIILSVVVIFLWLAIFKKKNWFK